MGSGLVPVAPTESRPESMPAVALPGNGRPRPARRVGLYQPWTASMDEGWIRWILRQYELPHRTLHDADVRAGALRSRFDTILLPSIGARTLREGHAAGSMPPEYCGGLGAEGEAALAAFVREGGRLVCLDASCDYALRMFPPRELPVEEVTSKLDAKKFSCPGSLLAVDLAARTPQSSPLLIGLPQRLVVPFQKSRAFTITAERARPAGRRAARALCRARSLPLRVDPRPGTPRGQDRWRWSRPSATGRSCSSARRSSSAPSQKPLSHSCSMRSTGSCSAGPPPLRISCAARSCRHAGPL